MYIHILYISIVYKTLISYMSREEFVVAHAVPHCLPVDQTNHI